MANSLFIIHKNTSHDKKQRRKCSLAKALHFDNPESFLASKFHYFLLHHFYNRKRVPLKKKKDIFIQAYIPIEQGPLYLGRATTP